MPAPVLSGPAADSPGPERAAPGHVAQFGLWLAGPEAVARFEVSRLDDADRRRFTVIRHPRRWTEFCVSRALRQHVAAPATAAISLSHSNGYAAFACGPAGTVIGVDLQHHRSRDVLAIARFSFAPEESACLERLRGRELDRMFHALWVMKEAMAKALQLPLLDALRHCVFGGAVRVPTQRFWSIALYEPRNDLTLALACVDGPLPADLQLRQWPSPVGERWQRTATISGPGEPLAGGSQWPSFSNHRLAAQCCPHHDDCITGAPEVKGARPN